MAMRRRTPNRHRLRPRAALAVAIAAGCGGGGGASLAITSTPSGSATVRAAWSYQAAASGAPAAGVDWSLASAPDGMTLSPAGLLEWTPAYADLGQHALALEAAHDGRTARQEWSLRVDQGLHLGVTLSPRGHTAGSSDEDYVEHFAGHAPWGRVIAFHGAWRASVEQAGELPALAVVGASAAQTYGFVPAIGIGWADGGGTPDLTSDSDPGDNSWSNQETRDEFRWALTSLAEVYQPPYLFLGNETNVWFDTHGEAEQWNEWLSQLAECRAAIRAVSPDTVVYTTFQLEMMKGLGAATNGWSFDPQWDLVESCVAGVHVDALGFTSYPYFEHAAPAAIPSDYYDEIAAHWSGPVAFTEIGWLAQAHPPYPGGEAPQRNFVGRFFELTAALDIEYAAWLFLHDWDGQDAQPAFAHIGLRDNEGLVVRPADARWRSEVALRE